MNSVQRLYILIKQLADRGWVIAGQFKFEDLVHALTSELNSTTASFRNNTNGNLFPEAIQRALRSHVNLPVGDRGCGEDFVVERVDRQRVPFAHSLHY